MNSKQEIDQNMNRVDTILEKMLTSKTKKDSNSFGNGSIDDVAWVDFATYEFLLKPLEPLPNILYIPSFHVETALVEIVESAGGDTISLDNFLSKLKHNISLGLLLGWERQKTEDAPLGISICNIRKFKEREQDYLLQELKRTLQGDHLIDESVICTLRLSSIIKSIFESITPKFLAELMTAYISSDFPRIPNADRQEMYWNYVREFFEYRFRPRGTGWDKIGKAYRELYEGNLPSQNTLRELVELVNEINEQFPIIDENESNESPSALEMLTVQSLYKKIEKLKHKIKPYPFTVFKPKSYNIGVRLIYRQEWRPIGDQRGEVVKTIPLAPRQSVKYSTKTIRRMKYSQSAEDTRFAETASETVNVSKDSSDISREVANTFKWHAEAEAAYGWGKSSHVKISGGLSGSKTNSTKLNSSYLSESTKKIATKTRTETKVVINTEKSAEFEMTEASEITNPNNEIPVTYTFSELQKQYEILTRLAETQNIVMIAERIPSPTEIDYDWVKKYDWIIDRVLLDDSYKDALTSISNDSESPNQGQLGLVLLQVMGAAMNNLSELAKNRGELSIGEVDFAQEAQRGFREFNKEELSRIKENQIIEIKRHRLYEHIRDNILYYQRAIWSQEDPQQRLLRYMKNEILVPTVWVFRPLNQNGQPEHDLEISDLIDRTDECDIEGYEYIDEIYGEFIGIGGHIPFHELINPAGPIGYFGNYSAFYIRPEYASITPISNLEAMLRFLQTPYFYYEESDSEGEFMDPVLIKYKKDFPPDSVLDEITNEIKYKMIQFVPKLRLEFEVARERSLNPIEPLDSGADIRFMLNNSVFANHYAEYLYREEMSRRIVIDTNNLVIDTIPGEGSILEDFKRAHRGYDALMAKLECERLRARLDKEKLDDPNADNKIHISADELLSGLKRILEKEKTE